MEIFANLMSTAAYNLVCLLAGSFISRKKTLKAIVDSPSYAIEVALHTLPRSLDGR